MPDSAASLSILKNTYVKQLNLTTIRTEEIITMAGPIQLNVIKVNIQIDDMILTSEILKGQIPDELPFDLLLGRNVLDLLDVYLLGKRQVICLKDP